MASLVLWGLAFAVPVFGLSSSGPSSELVTLTIEAPAELAAPAGKLDLWQPERLAGFAEMIGLARTGPEGPLPVRVVLATEASAAELGAPGWVAGYARGDAGVVVLFPSRVPVYPDRSLEELLGHEIAQLLILEAAGGRPLPRWFQEGLAMLAEEAWGLEDRSRVALALLRHGRADLAGLDARFGDPRQVSRSYALAGAFVRDVIRRAGPELPAEVLSSVAAGKSFDEAFARSAGVSLAEAEESFWRRFTLWYRWLPFLTSSTTLWMMIMLLALVAIRRRRQRDRALREQWEAEEAWERSATERLLADGEIDEPVN